MSCIGKQSIVISSGVEVKLEGDLLKSKKRNSAKELDTKASVSVETKDNNILFFPKGEDRQGRAYWGAHRVLAYNIVVGLAQGFSKTLEINGVGYKAALKGKVLELSLGFSYSINYDISEGIEITMDKNNVVIRGSDKQVVGQVAVQIRELRPPGPCKGRGVKYSGERIIRKTGRTSKK